MGNPPLLNREIGIVVFAILFTFLFFWGCDTTTGCLGDFQTKAHATDLGPGEEITVRCVVPPTPTSPPSTPSPSPAPTPPPTPEPTEVPTLFCDATPSPQGLQAAVDNAHPGDVICAEEGIINTPISLRTSGTPSNPITLVFMPGAIFSPGVGSNSRFEVWGDNWVIKDMVAINYYAFRIFADNITLILPSLHFSRYTALDIIDAKNITIVDPYISWPGHSEPNRKYSNSDSGKQIHAIYAKNQSCVQMTGITILDGLITDVTGRAVHLNSEGCSIGITGTLVDGLRVNRTSFGIINWGDIRNSTFRNLSFILYNYPPTNDTEHRCVGYYTSEGNIFSNSVCSTPTLGNRGNGCGQDHMGGSYSNTYTSNVCTN